MRPRSMPNPQATKGVAFSRAIVVVVLKQRLVAKQDPVRHQHTFRLTCRPGGKANPGRILAPSFDIIEVSWLV